MFLSCLFCLWGSESKEGTPPSSFDRGGSASSSGVSGLEGVMSSRQSSGGLSQGSAASAEPIVLSPYYYQKEEQLRRLGQLYEQNPNDSGVCKAIANALNKLGGPEVNEDCAAVISELEISMSETTDSTSSIEFIRNEDTVGAFRIQYDAAIRKMQKIANEASFDQGIKDIAPLTFLEVKLSYYSAIGNVAKVRAICEEQSQLKLSLLAWVEAFIEKHKK